MEKATKKTKMQELETIIETLRSENGCPWDREQTFQSLKPCIMEEACEVTSAIRIYDQTGNYENLREELGDLLLQVFLLSQIAKDDGLFSIEDVVDEISKKMIRRHPHVFGDAKVRDSKEVLKNWDEIKKEEKKTQTWVTSPLTEIPRELPSLTRATKVIKKMDKVYGEKISEEESLKNILEMTKELSVNKDNKTEYEGRLSEMLWDVCNLAKENKISIEQVFNDHIENHIERVEKHSN